MPDLFFQCLDLCLQGLIEGRVFFDLPGDPIASAHVSVSVDGETRVRVDPRFDLSGCRDPALKHKSFHRVRTVELTVAVGENVGDLGRTDSCVRIAGIRMRDASHQPRHGKETDVRDGAQRGIFRDLNVIFESESVVIGCRGRKRDRRSVERIHDAFDIPPAVPLR